MSQYKTSSAVFFLDDPALGHPSVAIYQGKVALQLVGAKLFSAPAKCGDQFEGLDSIVENALCGHWATAIKVPLVDKSEVDAVSYKLTVADHADSVAADLKNLMSTDKLVGDFKAQSLNDSATPWLWGCSPTYVRFDYEPNYLASIRVVSSGTSKMLLVNPAECVKFLSGNAEALILAGGKQEMSLSTLTKFVQNLTGDMAKVMAEQECHIYSATVTKGEANLCPKDGYVERRASTRKCHAA